MLGPSLAAKDVEAVGIEGCANPGPPEGNKQGHKAEEAPQANVAAELGGELGNGDNKGEVLEQFEPRGSMAGLFDRAVAYPEAGRLEQGAYMAMLGGA